MATYLTSLAQCGANASLTFVNAGLNVVGNASALQMPAGGYSRALTFTLGQGATALLCDTLHNSVRSIAASGSDTLTLSALAGTSTDRGSTTTMYDVCEQSTPVFARVRAILIELLGTAYTPTPDVVTSVDPAPTAASSLNVGNAGANVWHGLINSTATFPILNGESMFKMCRSAAGMAVASGSADQLKLANADAGLSAAYRIVIFGGST